MFGLGAEVRHQIRKSPTWQCSLSLVALTEAEAVRSSMNRTALVVIAVAVVALLCAPVDVCWKAVESVRSAARVLRWKAFMLRWRVLEKLVFHKVDPEPYDGPLELVMADGMQITATNSFGTIKIKAEGRFKRIYTWGGDTRWAFLDPRRQRWNGSLGIYCSGTGDHWKEHSGVTRGVLGEGQQHFSTREQAVAWLQRRPHGSADAYADYVWRNDGLAVGWGKTLERCQLNVDVWQMYIAGSKPTRLPGSQNHRISVYHGTP